MEIAKLQSDLRESSENAQRFENSLETMKIDLDSCTSNLNSCKITEQSLKHLNQEAATKTRQLTDETTRLQSNLDACSEEHLQQQFENADLLRKVQSQNLEAEMMKVKVGEWSAMYDEVSSNYSYLERDHSMVVGLKEDIEYELNNCRSRIVYFETNRDEGEGDNHGVTLKSP
jgi:chromosome segregation ATPase